MPFKKGKSGNDLVKWEKGQSGNPNGRPKKLIKKLEEIIGMEFKVNLSRADHYQILKWLLERTVEELKEVATSKKSPVFVVTIASALRKDITQGRIHTIETLYNRFFGTPKQTLDVKADLNVNNDIDELGLEELRELKAKLRDELNQSENKPD